MGIKYLQFYDEPNPATDTAISFTLFRLASRTHGVFNHYGAKRANSSATAKPELRPIKTLLVSMLYTLFFFVTIKVQVS
jgi:hypothetical protein